MPWLTDFREFHGYGAIAGEKVLGGIAFPRVPSGPAGCMASVLFLACSPRVAPLPGLCQAAWCAPVQLFALASLPAASTGFTFLTLDSWLILSIAATLLIGPGTLYPTHLPTAMLPNPSTQLSTGLIATVLAQLPYFGVLSAT